VTVRSAGARPSVVNLQAIPLNGGYPPASDVRRHQRRAIGDRRVSTQKGYRTGAGVPLLIIEGRAASVANDRGLG